MSGFWRNNQNLDDLFFRRISTKRPNVNFSVGTGADSDLSDRYEPVDVESNKISTNTNYTINGTDLRDLYRKKDGYSISGNWSSTSENYSTYNSSNNGTLTININTSYLGRNSFGQYSISISGVSGTTYSGLSSSTGVFSHIYSNLEGSPTGNRFESATSRTYTVTINDLIRNTSITFNATVGYNNGNFSGNF